MMYHKLLLLGWVLMLSSNPAYALFCGSRIVSEGDDKIEVLKKCGEPTFAEERVVYETFRVDPYGRIPSGKHRHTVPLPGQRTITIPIQVEIWTYNFGPHRLMYRLRFVEGTLRDIRTLGYGY